MCRDGEGYIISHEANSEANTTSEDILEHFSLSSFPDMTVDVATDAVSRFRSARPAHV